MGLEVHLGSRSKCPRHVTAQPQLDRTAWTVGPEWGRSPVPRGSPDCPSGLLWWPLSPLLCRSLHQPWPRLRGSALLPPARPQGTRCPVQAPRGPGRPQPLGSSRGLLVLHLTVGACRARREAGALSVGATWSPPSGRPGPRSFGSTWLGGPRAVPGRCPGLCGAPCARTLGMVSLAAETRSFSPCHSGPSLSPAGGRSSAIAHLCCCWPGSVTEDRPFLCLPSHVTRGDAPGWTVTERAPWAAPPPGWPHQRQGQGRTSVAVAGPRVWAPRRQIQGVGSPRGRDLTAARLVLASLPARPPRAWRPWRPWWCSGVQRRGAGTERFCGRLLRVGGRGCPRASRDQSPRDGRSTPHPGPGPGRWGPDERRGVSGSRRQRQPWGCRSSAPGGGAALRG